MRVSKEKVRNLNERLGAFACAVGDFPAHSDTLASGGLGGKQIFEHRVSVMSITFQWQPYLQRVTKNAFLSFFLLSISFLKMLSGPHVGHSLNSSIRWLLKCWSLYYHILDLFPTFWMLIMWNYSFIGIKSLPCNKTTKTLKSAG